MPTDEVKAKRKARRERRRAWIRVQLAELAEKLEEWLDLDDGGAPDIDPDFKGPGGR